MARARTLAYVGALGRAVRTATRPGGPSIGERAGALPRMVAAIRSGEYTGTSMVKLGLVVAGAAYVVSPVDLLPRASSESWAWPTTPWSWAGWRPRWSRRPSGSSSGSARSVVAPTADPPCRPTSWAEPPTDLRVPRDGTADGRRPQGRRDAGVVHRSDLARSAAGGAGAGWGHDSSDPPP